MFEIACHHRKAAAMRQPVGKECDQRSADDREQAETGPGKEQQPETRPVDAASACAPASTLMTRPKSTGSANSATATATLASARSQPVRAELCKNTGVKVKKPHGSDCSRFSPYLLSVGGLGSGAAAGGVGAAGGVDAAAGGAVQTL